MAGTDQPRTADCLQRRFRDQEPECHGHQRVPRGGPALRTGRGHDRPGRQLPDFDRRTSGTAGQAADDSRAGTRAAFPGGRARDRGDAHDRAQRHRSDAARATRDHRPDRDHEVLRGHDDRPVRFDPADAPARAVRAGRSTTCSHGAATRCIDRCRRPRRSQRGLARRDCSARIQGRANRHHRPDGGARHPFRTRSVRPELEPGHRRPGQAHPRLVEGHDRRRGLTHGHGRDHLGALCDRCRPRPRRHEPAQAPALRARGHGPAGARRHARDQGPAQARAARGRGIRKSAIRAT